MMLRELSPFIPGIAGIVEIMGRQQGPSTQDLHKYIRTYVIYTYIHIVIAKSKK
jgi:hypothetical protein